MDKAFEDNISRMVIIAPPVLLAMFFCVYLFYLNFTILLQPQLLKQAGTYLTANGYHDVKLKFDYLDVIINGSVERLEDVDKIRLSLDNIRGVRALKINNNIKVHGRLKLISDEKGNISISGFMGKKEQDYSGLNPSAVKINSYKYVIPPTALQGKNRKQLFFELVNKILGTKDKEITVIRDKVTIKGKGTIYEEKIWHKQFKRLGLKPETDMNYIASIYHSAGYRPRSNISMGKYTELKKKLSSLPILFHFTEFDFPMKETGKIEQITQIMRKNPEITFVIGGHISPEGSLKLGKQIAIERAKKVYWAFIRRGIRPEKLEIAEFGPDDRNLQNGRDLSSKVEVLIH